jgi:hypothetical protein
MTCPGSIPLCRDIPDPGSIYADEGTAAHTVAQWVLEQDLPSAAAFKGRYIPVGERTFEVDEEMVEAVDAYVVAVRGFARGEPISVEVELPLDHLTGEKGAAGTADALFYIPESRELHVHDLKYGRGEAVVAEENKQGLTYALAAYDLRSLFDDIERVVIVIHQPRLGVVDDWACDLERLEKHRQELAEASELVEQAKREHPFGGGAGYSREWAAKYLKVSPKGCRFCRAKPDCPAFQKTVVVAVRGKAAAADDFEDLTVENIQPALKALPSLPNTAIAAKLAVVDTVEEWCRAVRARAESLLLAGEPVHGFKLVEGRRGARQWRNPEEAEIQLKTFRLKKEEMYDFKLISPTTAEKLVKAGTIGERQWNKLAPLIVQKEGKPSVVPESDKRPALAVGANFDNLDEKELA